MAHWWSFTKIFRALGPELFIDNHVSNGADYQYALTHLFTQHNKLGGEAGVYLNEILMPRLQDSLKAKQWDITPYVNVFNSQPEKGFTQFMDSPRYSTGYTTLYNTLGMMVETHMLKPYKQRVEGTYELMKSFIAITDADAKNIKNIHSPWSVSNHGLSVFLGVLQVYKCVQGVDPNVPNIKSYIDLDFHCRLNFPYNGHTNPEFLRMLRRSRGNGRKVTILDKLINHQR